MDVIILPKSGLVAHRGPGTVVGGVGVKLNKKITTIALLCLMVFAYSAGASISTNGKRNFGGGGRPRMTLRDFILSSRHRKPLIGYETQASGDMPQCGLRSKEFNLNDAPNFILGGDEADIEQFPWNVALSLGMRPPIPPPSPLISRVCSPWKKIEASSP